MTWLLADKTHFLVVEHPQKSDNEKFPESKVFVRTTVLKYL